jgi:hypothetical protein
VRRRFLWIALGAATLFGASSIFAWRQGDMKFTTLGTLFLAGSVLVLWAAVKGAGLANGLFLAAAMFGGGGAMGYFALNRGSVDYPEMPLMIGTVACGVLAAVLACAGAVANLARRRQD